jgi:hypothetical protein
MSLLIIRCPLKPFAGTDAASPSDWQDLSCAEQFEWCLLDDVSSDGGESSESELAVGTQFGVGTTESMPYADEALVLLPSLDVRLIDAKVPLANAKKLQQILPNLIEDYVLTGVDSIAAQALPPVPGSPALQRTLALIDRAWLSWLNQQLERLLAPRVRLIPECLLLSVAVEGEPSMLAYQRFEDSIIFTQRTGLQLGVSWVEHEAAGTGTDIDVEDIVLPQALVGSALKEIAWEWVIPAAKEYLQINHNSRAPNFALNLLPKHFKRDAKSFGKSGLASVTGIFSGKGLRSSINAAGLAWTDPLVWRQALNWLRYFAISLVLGYGVYLSWMMVSNWRWGKQMELLSVQSLSPASVAALNQAKDSNSAAAVLNTFTKQATLDQRRRGVAVDADFAAMAAKLQQLKAAYGPEVLQKIEYDGYAIVFELKPSVAAISPKEVLKRARSMGMAITALGSNQYRLEPYSGLGGDL